MEASQITGFRQDGRGKDGTNSGNRLELLIVRIVGEARIRLRFAALSAAPSYQVMLEGASDGW
jgi:hypothetical protein